MRASPPKAYEAEITEFALAISLLMRRIRSAAPAELQELSWTQKAVVARLDREGALTTAELARAEGVKPQSMGAAVAGLEEIGIVERRPNPDDGRQLNIKLTAKGSAIRKNMREIKETWLSQAFGKLDSNERATLFEAGEIIKRLVKS